MFDPQAAKKRCEAATDLTLWAITAREDGFCVGNGRGHSVAPHIRNQADAELFVHACSDLLAALEALEEAQTERDEQATVASRNLRQLAEAQGKLEAVQEYTLKLDGFASRVARAVAREIRDILRSKEGE